MTDMEPAIIVLSAWLLFGGSHLGLSSFRGRARLEDKIGARGFTFLFAGVTVFTLTLLILAALQYGHLGHPGVGLSAYPAARWGGGGVAVIGAILAMAGLINYPQSPMSVLATRRRAGLEARPLKPPNAIDRVSRHPFFVGLALMMVVHALLASTLAGSVYFLGFAALSVIGIWAQDRKLRKKWDNIYRDYENQTSAVPFTASKIVGPTKAEWGRWGASVLGGLMLFGFLHPVMSYGNGAGFAVFILLFGTIGVGLGLAKSRKT